MSNKTIREKNKLLGKFENGPNIFKYENHKIES